MGDRFKCRSRFNGRDRFESRLIGFKKFMKIGDRFTDRSRFRDLKKRDKSDQKNLLVGPLHL